MTADLDESIPLSRALALAVSVQDIGAIAAENVRDERGQLPAADEAMISAFEAGLLRDCLVIDGPLTTPALGHLLVFLVELDDEETLRIFYEEADERVGGVVWALLSEGDRTALIREGQSLAAKLLPIYERHGNANPAAGQ